MKHYRFPLARLARVRAAQLDLAASELASANTTVRAAETEQAAALAQLEGTSELGHFSTPQGFESWLDRRRAAHRGLLVAGEALDAARLVQAEQLGIWKLARQDDEVLLRLDARRRQEWRQEASREEVAVLDEFTMQRRSRATDG